MNSFLCWIYLFLFTLVSNFRGSKYGGPWTQFMKGVHEPDPRRGSMDQESMFCTFPFFGLVSTLFLRRARQILKRVHLSGGLWLRNYCAVAGNHKFSMQFSVFACFCGGYSNRVKRLRRLSGNFILLKASLLTKDCLLGLDLVSHGFPLCPHPCGEGW